MYTTFAPAMECDLNFHKSNSTYFSDLDIARTDLMVDVFRDMLSETKKKEGFYPYIPLGAVTCIFKRELKPYQQYKIRSKVLGWDEKWLFVLSKFEYMNGKLAAVAVTKYVFKLKRRTIPPKDAIQMCYQWSEELEKKGREGMVKVKGLLEIEALEDEPM